MVKNDVNFGNFLVPRVADIFVFMVMVPNYSNNSTELTLIQEIENH